MVISIPNDHTARCYPKLSFSCRAIYEMSSKKWLPRVNKCIAIDEEWTAVAKKAISCFYEMAN